LHLSCRRRIGVAPAGLFDPDRADTRRFLARRSSQTRPELPQTQYASRFSEKPENPSTHFLFGARPSRGLPRETVQCFGQLLEQFLPKDTV